MALCGTCSAVPFFSLPEPLKPSGAMRIADRSNLPELRYVDGNGPSESASLGVAWHENLHHLGTSAKSCALCGLVQEGVEAWIHELDDARKNHKHFMEFRAELHDIPQGERLWLTKRYGGGPGFIVLARNPNVRNGVIMLTGVSFSVESNNPLSLDIKLSPMTRDSGSDRSLDMAKSWVMDCVNNHKSCADTETILPSRILDITSSSDVIKLVDGNGQSGRYASLSYCWGDGPHYKTNRENMMARQLGFHLSELPRTLHDAVVIARHLGLKFLWIDSLCICQDDAEEWARESAKMIDVYSNAHVVIAANHAKNSSEGCFHSRPARPEADLLLPGSAIGNQSHVGVKAILLVLADETPWGHFEGEPLGQRGWALQERVLAGRILHYNTRQLYFECGNGITSEDGYSKEERFCSLHGKEGLPFQNVNSSTWYQILRNYGERNLSRATDMMPALSGLARLFEQKLGAKYVAGLWSNDLVRGLAWQGIGSRRVFSYSQDGYFGPSWSWANYGGIAAVGVRRSRFKDIAEIEEWHVEPKTELNPYGEIKDAWIRLRAPMAKLSLSLVETTEYETRLLRCGISPLPRMCTRYSTGTEGRRITFDHEEEERGPIGWREWNLELLVLGGYPEDRKAKVDEEADSKNDIPFYYCLVVMKTDDSQGIERMKRMGWMFLDADEATKVRESDENWRTITLV